MGKEKPQVEINLLEERKENVIEPEIEGETRETLPQKGLIGIVTKKIQNSRSTIERRVSAIAIKLGLDPKPLIKGVWEVLLLLPRLVLLVLKLSWDKRVPMRLRLLCMAGLVYIVSPLDFIPEGVVGALGYLDDLAIALVILDILLNNIEPEVIQEHWNGDEDVLKIIRESVSLAKVFLPPHAEATIKKFFRLKKENE